MSTNSQRERGLLIRYDDVETLLGRLRTTLEIEVLMLWPHDEVMREVTFESTWSKIAVAVVEADAAGIFDPSRVKPEQQVRLMRKLAACHRREELRDRELACFNHGKISGLILSNIIEQAEKRPGAVSLSDAKNFAVSNLACLNGIGGVSRSTIENVIWAPYKPVSHLWAAFIELADSEVPIEHCMHGFGPVSKFLKRADAIRKRAEAIRPVRAATPVLPTGTAHRIVTNISSP